MLNKTLITLAAVTALAIGSTAMARGGGGSVGGKGGSGGGHFHGHFGHHFHFGNRFLRNQAVSGGWGWGLGSGYGDNGYGNTTVVAFPQAIPQAANVTGSISNGPCHWKENTFTVPSSASGTGPVSVVSCQ